MITINPIKFNNNKPISFGQGNLNNITPGMGILAVQSDGSKIKFEKDNFEKNLIKTQKADMVLNNNIFSAAWEKGHKAINILFNQPTQQNKVDENYRHIAYTA